MSIKPTHTAFIVIEPKEGSERKSQWHEIGAIWPHTKGKGFDLVIRPASASPVASFASSAKSRTQPPNCHSPSPLRRRGLFFFQQEFRS